MDRRESIKTMALGSLATSFILSSCVSETDSPIPEISDKEIKDKEDGYGRTPQEEARDVELKSWTFFSEHEMTTITLLAAIIIPASDNSGSIIDAEVPEFIEFIAKDIPDHQIPLRGGLRWLDHESNRRFDKLFKESSSNQQLEILDDIAYPDDVKPGFQQGTVFFSRLRNLVTTGYFTSKTGVEYLGYLGNTPTVWDGVPQDELDKHKMKYDEKTLAQCIKPDERNDIMNWENYEIG